KAPPASADWPAFGSESHRSILGGFYQRWQASIDVRPPVRLAGSSHVLLGHATMAMTMRYAHLAPEHLRSEVAKTERRAEPASRLAQESTQEAVELVGVSQKSS